MDTRNRARQDEEGIELRNWIDTLERIGIDTTKALPEEHALLRNQQTIHQHYDTYRAEQNKGISAAATRVMEQAGNYDGFATALSTAALATDASIVDRAQQIAALAAEFSVHEAFTHFRRRGEGIYVIIRGVFEETRDAIIRDGEALPDGVVDLDSATRVGVESEWLRLEALVERWDRILELIDAWYTNGVFATDGRNLERYNVWMFVYENYEAARDAHGVGILRVVRQVTAGDAKLLTIDEVDELGSNTVKQLDPNESRAANYRQQQADDEANKILRAEWEANGGSARLNKRPLKVGSRR